MTDEQNEGGHREASPKDDTEPQRLFTTSRPQGEEVREARVALRDAGYDYDKLTKQQLVTLATWAFPAVSAAIAQGETKTELVRALKQANVR